MKQRSLVDQEWQLARNMRRYCKGAFGNMGTDEYNHRVLGTNGPMR